MLIAVLTTTLSSMFLIISLRSTIQTFRGPSSLASDIPNEAKFLADSAVLIDNPIITVISLLLVFIGLLVVMESLFLWVPYLKNQ
ncbi:MAG: hypothetical protein ACFFAE_21620, partial [Candidatus Hodarchaeota archaeon]